MYCQSCNFDLRGLTTNICPECGRTFNPADASTFLLAPRSWLSQMLPRILLMLGLLIGCVVIAGVYLAIRGAQTAMLAEERLQATSLVCDLIAEHVEQSPTHSWPTSWADLEKLPLRENVYSWPREADKFKKIVTIDFTLTTAEVLKQTPETCTAVTISPGPNFVGFPAREFYPLFDRLRELPPLPRPPPQPGPPPKD